MILTSLHFFLQIRDTLKCESAVKYFTNSEKMFQLLQKKWPILEEMKKVLHVPFLTTKVLQRNDFTLSDLFGCIQIIELKLNEFIHNSTVKHTKLPEKLKACLLQRKSKLLDNPLMMCALFLDPRHKRTIDNESEKLMFVKITLENIWQRIKSLNGIRDHVSENVAQAMNASDEDDINKYYGELDKLYGELKSRD